MNTMMILVEELANVREQHDAALDRLAFTITTSEEKKQIRYEIEQLKKAEEELVCELDNYSDEF